MFVIKMIRAGIQQLIADKNTRVESFFTTSTIYQLKTVTISSPVVRGLSRRAGAFLEEFAQHYFGPT
jgi:hypothetical protein